MLARTNHWVFLARCWTHCSVILVALGAIPTDFTDAQEVMRFAAWNTANKPNTPEDAGAFKTVLAGIGEEEVDGVAKRLDILAVSETDTASSQTLVGLMNDLYGVDSYHVVTSSPDGRGDRTGFVYDTSTVALLDSAELRQELTRSILSAQF